jgi:hypothetical protein
MGSRLSAVDNSRRRRRPTQPTSRRRPPTVLDLNDVVALINSCADLAERLHGEPTTIDPQDGPGRVSNPRLAGINHDLLYLSSLLRLAAGEVDMRYQRLRGRTDPRTGAPDPGE